MLQKRFLVAIPKFIEANSTFRCPIEKCLSVVGKYWNPAFVNVILIFRLKAASLRFLFRSFFCSSVSLTVGLFFFVPAILFSPSTVHIFAAHLYLSFGCSIRLFHSSGVFDKALPLGS